MAIDYITQQPTLPKIDRDMVLKEGLQKGTSEIVDYLIKLVRVLQEDLIRTVINVTNNQLKLINVGVVNFDLPDINGSYKNGDIRLIKTNGGIELQQRANGSWTDPTSKLARWEI